MPLSVVLKTGTGSRRARRDLGRAAGCLTYLPDVVIEHVRPVAGKAAIDEGYRRVNAPEMYHRDRAAYRTYMSEYGGRDVAAVRQALAGVTTGSAGFLGSHFAARFADSVH